MCSIKKGVLENFAKFTEKHMCQSSIFKNETLEQAFSFDSTGLQHFLKRDSGTGVFL